MDQQQLLVIAPQDAGQQENHRLDYLVRTALANRPFEVWTTVEQWTPQRHRPVLFILNLGEDGINLEYQRMLRYMRRHGDCLQDCIGGVLVDAQSEWYTKATGRELVFTANSCGCIFPGKPLVEGTQSLDNFIIQARNLETDRMGAYQAAIAQLLEHMLSFQLPLQRRPHILAVHASNRTTSNTLTLWGKVKQHLEEHCNIQEISLQNGTVVDCNGCPYQTCRHFGETCSCFYGGVMVEEVYPAILNCDALIVLCPNYNDAISANLSAFINRLTALFSQVRFYEKAVFCLVVSGYSGGDIVAKQILGALNMNKTFFLPARFSLLATANDPFSINKIADIDQRAQDFAENMLRQLCRDALMTPDLQRQQALQLGMQAGEGQ